MIKKLFDKTLRNFILVGIINTLVGTGVMFLFYNVFYFSYWISSASNYIVGSIVSYFLNKHFTFKVQEKSIEYMLKFALNVAICYLLAYGIAKPLASAILSSASVPVQENVSMAVGMCIYVGLNYLGQRFFVFKKKDE